MQSPLELLKQHLSSGELDFTELADGSGVLLHVGSRTVLTLNTSAARLVAFVRDHRDATEDELIAQLKGSAAPEDRVSDEDIRNDVSAFLDTISRALDPDPAHAFS